MRPWFFIIGPCLLVATVSCREEEPVADVPVAEAERQQFENPLQLACWHEPGSWPQFAHDPLHTGRADVDLGSADLELAWQFKPPGPPRTYEAGFSVWSSPVVGTVGDRSLVIAGYCDRVVYALDGRNGAIVWEFRPGGCVFASPTLGLIDGKPRVFVASNRRWIYALDADTGEKAWPEPFETAPWTFTMDQSVMSSPTLVDTPRGPILVVGVHNRDRSASRNLQQGEVVVLDAKDGTLVWRKRLASVPVTSPAVARMGDEVVVFVATHHGTVHALRLADGEQLWQAVLNEQTRSSPSICMVGDAGRVLIGSRLNSVFGLDWRTGTRRWRADTGYWIDATPAWFVASGPDASRTTVAAGSYDRSIYAWPAGQGEPLWATTTGNHAYSSVAVARLRGAPVVLAMSWDQRIYLLDGATGESLWSAESGPFLWSHAFMGDSLWASPVVAKVAGHPTVLFPACDGVLYAYWPREPRPSQEPTPPG